MGLKADLLARGENDLSIRRADGSFVLDRRGDERDFTAHPLSRSGAEKTSTLLDNDRTCHRVTFGLIRVRRDGISHQRHHVALDALHFRAEENRADAKTGR